MSNYENKVNEYTKNIDAVSEMVNGDVFSTPLTTNNKQLPVLKKIVNEEIIKEANSNGVHYTKKELDNIVKKVKKFIIETPSITSPLNNSISVTGEITSSQFFSKDEYFLGNHDSSDWEVSLSHDFLNIENNLSSYKDTLNKTTFTISPISINTTYYVRVRYESDNHFSDWSQPVRFTTVSMFIETPTLTINGGTPTSLHPSFKGSKYNIVNDNDPHLTTYIIIATDPEFNNIVLNDTIRSGDLTTYTITNDVLKPKSNYYTKIKYNSNKHSSAWSNIVTFSTIDKTNTPIITGSSSFNENSTEKYTITNYSPNFNYNISVSIGDFTFDDNTGEIYWSVGEVNNDVNATLSVIAQENGKSISDNTIINVTIVNYPMVEDQSIVYNTDLDTIQSEIYKETSVIINDDGSVYGEISKDDILDHENTSTVSKIYINNILTDVVVGDTLTTDNGETFTVSVVNNDGNVASISGVKSVACGGNYTVVIKYDNTMWVTGRNSEGQLGLGDTNNVSSFTNTGETANYVACGTDHTVIIKNDNTVWVTGYNYYGQLGLGNTDNVTSFTNTGVSAKQVACGANHTVIIKDDNTVWVTGWNNNGQLGLGDTISRTLFTNTGVTAKQVDCGYFHTLIIKDDNTVWSTGRNNYGQLGLGNNTDLLSFTNTGVTANYVSCGGFHTLIIKDDNTVWSTGFNNYGQLGLGDTTNVSSFTNTNINTRQVASGFYHAVIIKDDYTVWSTGRNSEGQLGLGDTNNVSSFTNTGETARGYDPKIKGTIIYYPNYWVEPETNITSIPNKLYHKMSRIVYKKIIQDYNDTDFSGVSSGFIEYSSNNIIDDNNTTTTQRIYINNKLTNVTIGEILGDPNSGETFTVSVVNNDGNVALISGVKSVACGDNHTVIIKDDNTVWVTGDNTYGQLGLGNTDNVTSFTNTGVSAKQVICGYRHTAIIKDDNTVWVTGDNTYGQLGLGNTDNVTSFTNTGVSAKQVACGNSHTVITKDDNTVWVTGHNEYGQLGLGNTDNVTSFTNTGVSAKQVACGNSHTVIIKDDNSVWVTGDNTYGQLGLGNTDNVTSFTNTGVSAKQVACGGSHTVIIKTDNIVWSTGRNNEGQLGLGDTSGRLSFTNSGVIATQVACGNNHTVIIKDDNTVWVTGDNTYGQLGLGHTDAQSSFSDTGVTATQVECGANHTVIIKDDNIVWTTGLNNVGQLGLGDTNNVSLFTYTGDSAIQISCGSLHTVIIKAYNNVWGTGWNTNGQLGLGDTNKRISFTNTNEKAKATFYTNYWVEPSETLTTAPIEIYRINNFILQGEKLKISSLSKDSITNTLKSNFVATQFITTTRELTPILDINQTTVLNIQVDLTKLV